MCIVRNKINLFEQLCWDWGACSVNNVLASRCEPMWGVLACMYSTSTGDKRILRPNWPANLAYLASSSAARDTTSPPQKKGEKRKGKKGWFIVPEAVLWPLNQYEHTHAVPQWTCMQVCAHTCGCTHNTHTQNPKSYRELVCGVPISQCSD